jgi:ribonuclease HII
METGRIDEGGARMRRISVVDPSLDVERGLFDEGFARVGAVDEVGRGSAFGPCCVGVVVIDANVGAHPPGLRDSKLLNEAAREVLDEPVRHWVRAHAVGESSAREIDRFGLSAALRLAGRRAMADLGVAPDVMLLDGSFDWLSDATATLMDPTYPDVVVPPVRTLVKADLNCASVAAASVLAKVYRDRLIRRLALTTPGYGLEDNKGYATPAHLAALRDLGPSDGHRLSWRLPSRVAS